MKTYLNNKGATLIIVLVVAVMLSILGVSLLIISVGEARFAQKQEENKQADYVSMSAANAFASHITNWPVPLEEDEVDARDRLLEEIMNNGTIAQTGTHEMDIDSSISDALQYSIELNRVYTSGDLDELPGDVEVIATGLFKNSQRNISFILKEILYFDTAIFSFTDINLINTAVADGSGAPIVAGGVAYSDNQSSYDNTEIYDSNPDTGDPTPYVNAYEDVFKPAPSSSYYSYPSGLKLNDDPLDDVNDADIILEDGLIIDYDTIPNAYLFNREVGDDTIQAKGIYFVAEDANGIIIPNQDDIYITNNSVHDLFIMFDRLTLNGSLHVTAESDGKVFILINDGIPDEALPDPDNYTPQNINDGELVVDGALVCTEDSFGNFLIYANETVNRLVIRTSRDPDERNALIIAPYSEVKISNTNDYTGAIIANKVVIENSSNMTYPNTGGLTGSDLGLPSLGYIAVEWNRP